MNFDHDHERFVNKNRSLAGGYELDRKDRSMEKKGFSRTERNEEASCFNCKLRAKCPEFRAKRTGGSSGVVSYGGGETFICKRFAPAPVQSKTMSQKKVKSLLKNAKKGL
jgi:hypothetical protein